MSDPPAGADDLSPWSIGEALGGFALSFFLYVLTGSAFLLIAHTFYLHHQLAADILSYQFLLIAVIATTVLLIFMRFHVGLEAVGFRFPGIRPLALAVILVIPILIGVQLASALLDLLFPGFVQGNARETLPVAHGSGTALKEVVAILWAGFEVPLVEETLFRGIVYQGMRRFFTRWLPKHGAIFAAALVSGLAFGLAHAEPHTFPILALLGIMLAYVFQYGRSVYASAIVHGLVNILAVVQVFNTA